MPFPPRWLDKCAGLAWFMESYVAKGGAVSSRNERLESVFDARLYKLIRGVATSDTETMLLRQLGLRPPPSAIVPDSRAWVQLCIEELMELPFEVGASLAFASGYSCLPPKITATERFNRIALRRVLDRVFAAAGYMDRSGWPLVQSLRAYYTTVPDPAVGVVWSRIPIPLAGELYIGNFLALTDAGIPADLVVSLCRTGTTDVDAYEHHLELWLNDRECDQSDDVIRSILIAGTWYVVDALRRGRNVLVHCAVGRSRSPSLAAIILKTVCHLTLDDGLSAVKAAAPYVDPVWLKAWCSHLRPSDLAF